MTTRTAKFVAIAIGLGLAASAAGCAKSQAYAVGPDAYPPDHPQPIVREVPGELPPYRFEPSVHQVHRAPEIRPVAFTSLPPLEQSRRCIDAGAVEEGRARPRPTPVVAHRASPNPASPSAKREAESTPTATNQQPASGADIAEPARAEAAPVSVEATNERKSRQASRKADRAQRRADRLEQQSSARDQSATPPATTYPQPPQEMVEVAPPAEPPASEGWGAATYLSNDDSMSLSSAQRIMFAVDEFAPLDPLDIRTHELLNWAFGPMQVQTAPDRDFGVEADLAPAPNPDGTYTMAVAVHGRRVGKLGRRNAVLTLVVDESGSMRAEGRMDFVRRGLLRMMRELKPGDVVNLVTFDHRVCPELRNFVVGRDDPEVLVQAFRRLSPRGKTNLHAGLTHGYDLADASYQAGYSNRVLVITDALANRGITEPRTLGMVSDRFDARRIRLSGIGVGREFGDELLDTLTERGRGAYVFLGSEAVVDEVFGDHFVSLIETIANDVHMRLHLPPTLRVQRFHGEQSSVDKREVQAVHFFADTSQVLLLDVEPWQGQLRGQDDVMLEIEYQEPETGELRVEEHVVHLGDAIGGRKGYAANARLVKAFGDALAMMAQFPPPPGHRARVGGWNDPGAARTCQEVRAELGQHESATWFGDALQVFDRYCSRYGAPAAGRPPRKW